MPQTVPEFSWYLFDADGTLFDTTDMIVECFQHTAGVYELPVPDRNAIIRHIGMTLRRQMEQYFGTMDDERFDRFRLTHMEYQLQIYKDHLQLCTGVAEALKLLNEREKGCAVVTSRMTETLTLYLRETGIYDYFKVLITPEATTKHKPDPEPAFAAMAQMEASAAETLFIGDATFDVECGSRAGCATAFVAWSHTGRDELTRKPDYFLNDMRDICQW